MTYAGIGGIGTPELIVILGICVLLFGSSRIPQLARSVGKSINEFKRGMTEVTKEGAAAEGEKKPDAAPAEKKD
ncbi:MAG: twin-arginine translocase TatA/TatE family subunit [Planctomycetes bacterium]|nr:twin-arginine translocase TatA/TatE family subunit [Planctomycetota bacterium]